MPLADFQKQRCLKVMDKIQKYHISRMFSQPVNPTTDNCPDYFSKITSPMDLGTARKKLDNNEYETVEQWKEDMELIWNNAFTYNGPKALISLLAKEIQTIFRDLTVNFSSDADADWNSQFEKLKSEINSIIKTAPKINSSSKSSSRRNTQTSQQVNSSSQKVNSKKNSNLQNSASKSTQNNSNLMTSSKSSQESVPTQQNLSQNALPTTRAAAPTMTPEEIKTLTEEVNLIEDSDQVQQIIDLVKRMEPSIEGGADDDEFVLEIEKLKDATLFELRALVSQILGR
ncbi:Bromodomain containing protein [Tritrichomonas foetus]|uniref:Bromodomain containing protein n=1 Tax=Tritrichomonas foetus TaxID=1144522 RepID=A0A1J4JJJ9_9EUKA|nr:Bromodomain containing protein [Tritrichomonas foetus]|eukprot:OHS99338.1 Bromodomain containing protein [Tritrichomonas foetus]